MFRPLTPGIDNVLLETSKFTVTVVPEVYAVDRARARSATIRRAAVSAR